MAAPPAQRECLTISMVMEKFKESDEEVEQFSPVHRFKGYPWRVRIVSRRHSCLLNLICDKAKEAELWKCDAVVRWAINGKERCSNTISFNSWRPDDMFMIGADCDEECPVEVEITTEDDGESWRRCAILDVLSPRDGILVIGEEKKRIYVNKESLASQSPFFDRLFYGDFKEKNMDEIPIGDVEYEEFANILKLVYRFDGASLTNLNADRVVELAVKFDLKIVVERCINYFLSPASSCQFHKSLFLSDKHNIPFVTNILIWRHFTNRDLKEIRASPELKELSIETVRALFKKSCDRA